jgi:hypothetical protein
MDQQQTREQTAAQVLELQKHIERGRADFPYFCEAVLGITLNSGQLKAWEKERRGYSMTNIYLCGNRSGKTVKKACKHIWMNFYKITGPGKHIAQEYWENVDYRTMNCAPHTNQTKIMFRTVGRIIRGQFPIRHADGSATINMSLIPWFIDGPGMNNPVDPPKQGPFEYHFANNAHMYCYTLGGSHGDAVQGEYYNYASYDEFGRSKAPDKEWDDITTRLGDWMGHLDIITTPDENNPDASDWLADRLDLCDEPNSGFRYFSWTTEDNEYMGKDSIEQILKGKNPEQQRRILKGALIKTSGKFFGYKYVNKILEENSRMIDFVNHFPDPRCFYSGGLDTSGKGKDSWSFYIYDITERPFRKVFDFTNNDLRPTENAAETRQIIENFVKYVGWDHFEWQIDYTSEGGTIVYDMLEDLRPIPFRFSVEKGSGKNMKVELCEKGRDCLYEDCLRASGDGKLHSQFASFRGPKDDKGQSTDRLMATLLAIYLPWKRINQESNEWIFDVDGD